MDHGHNEAGRRAEDRLAQLLSRELGALPLRRAPASLEARVFAELARRQALPWWRQSFRAWPMAAQVAFAVVALAVTHALFWVLAGSAVGSIVQDVQSTGHQAWLVVQAAGAWLGTLNGVARDVFSAVPSRWWLVLMLATASSIGLLVGGGTFVYRSLYSQS